MAVTDKVRRTKEATDDLDEKREEATEAAKERLEDAGQNGGKASETAGDAVQAAINTVKDSAKGGTQGVLKTVASAARDAAAEVLAREASKGARQAAEYVSQKAPEIAMQKLQEHGGSGPAAQAAMSYGKAKLEGAGGAKALLSSAGGAVKGVVDKVTGAGSDKGKGGGAATGYGVKRRMPIQQDMFVSVSCEDAYKGWTEYKRWTEFMFRANQVDSEIEDEEDGEARIKVTEKMWMFKRPFTALVVSQVPNEHIRWRSTDGTKHVGTISFHPLGDRLTLISVNIDHAPAGPIEKISRGARFDKRAIRADFHRFKGWIETKSSEDIEEIEGWLGTIEDGKITQTHQDYLESQESDEEEPTDEERTDVDGNVPDEEPEAEADDEEPEAEEDEEPEAEVDEEPEAEVEEKPKPKPRRRPQQRRQRAAARK